MTFLGIPTLIWGILCLLMAAVWLFVRPEQAQRAVGAHRIILLWFHWLTWVLLGVAALIVTFGGVDAVGMAKMVAVAALVVYLLFIAALLSRQSR